MVPICLFFVVVHSSDFAFCYCFFLFVLLVVLFLPCFTIKILHLDNSPVRRCPFWLRLVFLASIRILHVVDSLYIGRIVAVPDCSTLLLVYSFVFLRMAFRVSMVPCLLVLLPALFGNVPLLVCWRGRAIWCYFPACPSVGAEISPFLFLFRRG